MIDELTYYVLVQRYKELQKGASEEEREIEEVPYDIDPYITEIDTGIIDAQYLNSRFEKYLKVLRRGDASEEERLSVLGELHQSFASLSQEEQRFAVIFLHDVENGTVDLEKGKTFKDYIIEYQARAQNDSIYQTAESFGLDESMLREIMNAHVTQDNLNEYNRFENLLKTANIEKTRVFFESQKGKSLRPFEVSRMLDDYMRRYILEGVTII